MSQIFIGKCARCGKADRVVLSSLANYEGKYCQFCWRGVLADHLNDLGYAPNTPDFAAYFDNDPFLKHMGSVRKKDKPPMVDSCRRKLPPC